MTWFEERFKMQSRILLPSPRAVVSSFRILRKFPVPLSFSLPLRKTFVVRAEPQQKELEDIDIDNVDVDGCAYNIGAYCSIDGDVLCFL